MSACLPATAHSRLLPAPPNHCRSQRARLLLVWHLLGKLCRPVRWLACVVCAALNWLLRLLLPRLPLAAAACSPGLAPNFRPASLKPSQPSRPCRSASQLNKSAWNYAAIPLIYLFMYAFRFLCLLCFNPIFKLLGHSESRGPQGPVSPVERVSRGVEPAVLLLAC